LAAKTTVPTPVSVTVLPEIVAGPDFTLKVTGKLLDEDGAVTANAASPKALLPMLEMASIVCEALLIVLLAVAMVFSVAPVLVRLMLPL
jgi:hypothetical protein